MAALCPLKKPAIYTVRKLPPSWLHGVMTTGTEVSHPSSSIAVEKVWFSQIILWEKAGLKYDHASYLLL